MPNKESHFTGMALLQAPPEEALSMIEKRLLEIFRPAFPFNNREDLSVDSIDWQTEGLTELSDADLELKPETYFSALFVALSEAVYESAMRKIQTEDKAVMEDEDGCIAFCAELLKLYLFVSGSTVAETRQSTCVKEYIDFSFLLVELSALQKDTTYYIDKALAVLEN